MRLTKAEKKRYEELLFGWECKTERQRWIWMEGFVREQILAERSLKRVTDGSREAYNAYQREYMRKKRAKPVSGG